MERLLFSHAGEDLEILKNPLKEVFVKSILLGWENITDAEGKKMDFTERNAMKLFNDLPDIYEDLFEQSSKASLFREASMEEDAKNS